MNDCLAVCGGASVDYPGPCAAPGAADSVGPASAGGGGPQDRHPIAGEAQPPATSSIWLPWQLPRPFLPSLAPARAHGVPPPPQPPRPTGLFASPDSGGVHTSADGVRAVGPGELQRFAPEGYTLAGVASTVDAGRLDAEKPGAARGGARAGTGGE
jgi:hypothetical protein